MACTCENCQDISNNRSEVINVFRVLVENFLSNVNKILKTACKLHCRNSSNYRSDDQDHVPRDVARLHAQTKTENQHACAARITDTDAAQPHADEDRAQEDDDLKNNHDTHKIFPINLGLRLVMQQSALGMERTLPLGASLDEAPTTQGEK